MSKLRVWEGYSLAATLAPSFVRVLFEKRGDRYVKVAGWRRGAEIWQEGSAVVSEGCTVEELSYWSGAWLGPHCVEGRAPHLATAHRELGLSVSPWDRHLLFVTIFLSRVTSWEANVLRWTKEIFRRADNLDDLLGLDFLSVSKSFQLRQLREALPLYAKGEAAVSHDPWAARRALLQLKHVGPKVADALLLFSAVDTSAAPIDRHAVRMAERIGLPARRQPAKPLCSRFTCTNCPAAQNCLRAYMASEYGPAAGWVQTALYVHDTQLCARRVCGACPLSAVCKAHTLSLRDA